jgi:hypothetical protein
VQLTKWFLVKKKSILTQILSYLGDILEDSMPGMLLGEGVDALVAAERPNLGPML